MRYLRHTKNFCIVYLKFELKWVSWIYLATILPCISLVRLDHKEDSGKIWRVEKQQQPFCIHICFCWSADFSHWCEAAGALETSLPFLGSSFSFPSSQTGLCVSLSSPGPWLTQDNLSATGTDSKNSHGSRSILVRLLVMLVSSHLTWTSPSLYPLSCPSCLPNFKLQHQTQRQQTYRDCLASSDNWVKPVPLQQINRSHRNFRKKSRSRILLRVFGHCVLLFYIISLSVQKWFFFISNHHTKMPRWVLLPWGVMYLWGYEDFC